ncbi:hypothetical protein [Pontibacter fetidus]|uniref:O-antigen ligase-like membrane protein n=1 Tax=Pontibacter fetidus TaxID=2700082 RepID=A0A6B2H6T1_9BACT|nr:hypothetical protein [Pontibacter fetidus]NDK55590.1 hypothetical protein [Pontibacter fetidus]
MKLYHYYIIFILLLALTLNWVVAGNNFLGKADMNLGLLPKTAIMVIEALQVIMLIRLLLIYPDNKFILGAIVAVVAFCLFEFLIIKAMRAHYLVWVSGIRYYFSFFPLFLVSYLIASKGHNLKQEMYWLTGLALLQVPVAVYQFLNTSSVQNLGDRQLLYDMISGTMGGFASNVMSLVVGIGLLYFLVQLFDKKKLIYLVLALLLLVPPILSEAKGMLFVLTIIFVYLAFIFKFSFSRLMLLGGLAMLMLVGFIHIYAMLGYGYGKEINLEYLMEYAATKSGTGRLSRIDSIIYSFNLLIDKGTLLFGTGIGNANKSPLGYDGQFYDFYKLRHSVDIFITETGLLGICFLSYLFWKLIRITRSLLKNEVVQQNAGDILILRVFLGTIFIFMFGMFWVDVLFRVQFMYPLGMMAGYVVGLYHKVKSEEEIATTATYQLHY